LSSADFDRNSSPENIRQSGREHSVSIRVALFSADQTLIDNLTGALSSDGRFTLAVSNIDSLGISGWLLRHPVELAIVDVEPPTNAGIRAMSLIANLRPGTQMMALMSRHSLDAATVAVQAGAQSCLLKESSGSGDVIAALNGLIAGSNAISPRIARVLINRFRQLH